MWVHLEGTMLSETTQTEEDNMYDVTSHLEEESKQQQIHRNQEQTGGCQRQERGGQRDEGD